MAKSKTKTIRASFEEWGRWEAAAGDISFNTWVKNALNSQAELDAALEREQRGRQEERARIVKKSNPQKSSGCKHEGYKHLPFCYACGERT